MKIAYRSADPKNIIAFGASITKEASPAPHLLVTAAGDGSRMIEYSAYASLVANDVSIVDYEGSIPSQFKSDASHTWNGTALVATAYVFPTPEIPAAPKADLTFGQFQDLCYNETDGGALGRNADPEGTEFEQFLAGAARYGAIVKAVEADITDLGRAILDRYNGGKSSVFTYSKTMGLLFLISGYLEPGEYAAISAAWPSI